MPSRLDRLLEDIHPTSTLEDVAASVDDAFNSFSEEAVGVEQWGWDDLDDYLGRFFQHIMCSHFRLNASPAESQEYLAMNAHVLEREYGRNWHKIVLRIVRKGVEGGLPVVLRNAARRLAEHWSHNRIGSLVSEYWEELSDDQRQAAAAEYLDKYGTLLSRDAREQLARQPWFFLPRILEEHPHLVARTRL